MIGNLSFTRHGVYAHYLLSGLPYYLQSTKRRTGVADRHQTLAREIPAGTWIYGLSVPQSQRRLLRAMLAGHRDKPQWINSCRQMAPVLAEQRPRTRIFWLAIPVDAGRAGHSPMGQAAKLRDWAIGRDKDSDNSVAAYQRLSHDVITALPEEFTPVAVTEDMTNWFWRHNAWRGVFDNPMPRHHNAIGRLEGTTLPEAVFDTGDQHHHRGRALPLHLGAAILGVIAAVCAVAGLPALAAITATAAVAAAGAWAAGVRRIPSTVKTLRVASPDGLYPDSYQAILPVVDMPKAGIVFPGSEFLQALDDLDTGAVFDFAVNLVTLSREMESVRNDRAKGNLDDQFTQRRDVANGDAQLLTTAHQLAEYRRQLDANIDERPLQAAFLIAVGAPTKPPWTTASNGCAKNSPAPAKSPSVTTAAPKPGYGPPSIPGHPTTKPAPTNSANPPPPANGHASCRSPPRWSATAPECCSDSPDTTRWAARSCSTCPAPRAATATPAWSAAAPGLRQILCRQTHHPRRNPARRTSIHHRPRHRMGKSPRRRPQQSRPTWPVTSSAATRCAPSPPASPPPTGWTTCSR